MRQDPGQLWFAAQPPPHPQHVKFLEWFLRMVLVYEVPQEVRIERFLISVTPHQLNLYLSIECKKVPDETEVEESRDDARGQEAARVRRMWRGIRAQAVVECAHQVSYCYGIDNRDLSNQYEKGLEHSFFSLIPLV